MMCCGTEPAAQNGGAAEDGSPRAFGCRAERQARGGGLKQRVVDWLLPGAQRRFVLLGIRGQMIFVDPASKLVMVHTAVRPKPVDRSASGEAIALWRAIEQELGGDAP